ncbi:hypothetical protein MANES_03G206101v8 [Manihot esculenta]|uniref:Uncharacterized protein n=1 Tax=Manihot esculenta TaxID=3983 RepID=A0ACB7I761_MANES|nr:hypothetical protein MANES_03G206101v8 [Manihot esculenta]
MKDHHTPLQEDLSNLKTKESRLMKPQKIAKKSLTGVFSLVSEKCFLKKSWRRFQRSQAPILSAKWRNYSIFIRSISSFWLNSKILTTADEPGDVSTELCGFHKPDGSVEVDIAANFLKLARIRVLNCANADQQSKKFIDALVKVVLDECYALPEEIDCYSCTFVFQSSCSVSLLLALELYSICDILLAQLNSDSGPSPT